MDTTTSLPRADRVGLYIAMGTVVIAGIGFVVGAVQRIIEVAAGRGIAVEVSLAEEQATLPLGPEGAPVEVTAETVTLLLDNPSGATLFALWAQPTLWALVVVTGLALAAVFFLRLARAQAFSAGTARLAYAGAGVVLAGWAIDTVLTNMISTGALAAISADTYPSFMFLINFSPLLWMLLLAATGAALQVGERLQHETEGLV